MEYKYIELLIFSDNDKRMWYRPKWRKFTQSVTANILLSQIFYWWVRMGQRPFYKQIRPTKNFFTNTESWLEEMGLSIKEFNSALKKIAYRKTKENEDEKHDKPVEYYVQGSPKERKTYFTIVPENLEKMLKVCYEEENKQNKVEKEKEISKGHKFGFIKKMDLHKFIEIYPRKTPHKMGELKTYWTYLCNRKRDKVTWVQLTRSIALHKKYVWADRDKEYIPYPTTFLKNKYWLNKIEPTKTKDKKQNIKTKLVKRFGKYDFKRFFELAKEYGDTVSALHKIETIVNFVKEKQNNNKTIMLIQNMLIPDHIQLTIEFLEWLKNETWITNKSIQNINPKSKLFQTFIQQKSNEYNILTGEKHGT